MFISIAYYAYKVKLYTTLRPSYIVITHPPVKLLHNIWLLIVILSAGAIVHIDSHSAKASPVSTQDTLPAPDTNQHTLVVLVPKTTDRVDRVGITAWPAEEKKMDSRTKSVRLYNPKVEQSLDEGLKNHWEPEDKTCWVVATGHEASQILNNYSQITNTLSTKGIADYKIVLLNPIESQLQHSSLPTITDTNLSVVEVDGSYSQEYNALLEKFRAKHNQEIVDWVRKKDIYKVDIDWGFMDDSDLYKLARVSTQTLGPLSLPKINSIPPTEWLTKERIVDALKKVQGTSPEREPPRALELITQEHPNSNQEKFFSGWTPEEIISYNDWRAKWVVNKISPYITFVSWGDNLLEQLERESEIPPAFSNRKNWEEGGFKVQNQNIDPGMADAGCAMYSIVHAFQGAMISSGISNNLIDHKKLTRIAYRDYRSFLSGGSGRQQSRKIGWSSARYIWDHGFEDALLQGIPLQNGKVFKPTQIIARDIKDFMYGPSSFPWWLKERSRSSMKGISAASIESGNAMKTDYEVATAYRDLLMKGDLSKGRPIIVGFFPFPVDKNKGRWGKGGWSTEENGDIVLRLWSHPAKTVAHNFIIVGYKPDPLNPRKTLYECLNTWGTGWGDKGYFWISSDLLDFYNTVLKLTLVSIEIR